MKMKKRKIRSAAIIGWWEWIGLPAVLVKFLALYQLNLHIFINFREIGIVP